MPFGERLEAIVLPCATLVLVVLAHMMRMTRAAILNVMSSPYVETAELKGLDTLRIIARHAAPNSLAPLINMVALTLASLDRKRVRVGSGVSVRVKHWWH